MRIDKETRDAIVMAVLGAQRDAAEMYTEQYVTGAELCKQLQMFTKDWLADYGYKLPRERVEVTGDDGKRRVSRWAYPLHRIQRMVAEGRMRDL